MRMRLRQGSNLGDFRIFPIYELDYAKMIAEIPAAFEPDGSSYQKTPFDVGSGDAKLRLHKIRVTSSQLYQYFPGDVPRSLTRYGVQPDSAVGGAIAKVNTNIDQGTTFNAAAYNMTQITKQPTDWGTNPQFIKIFAENRSGTPSNSYRPWFSFRCSETWYDPESNQRYYNDIDAACGSVYYTGVGSCHFSMIKNLATVQTGPYYLAPCINIGFPPGFDTNFNSFPAADQTLYGICNKNNSTLFSLLPTDKKYTCYVQDYNTYNTATDYNNRNWWQFFVHYSIEGEDFYGICHAKFTTAYNNTDSITQIDVIGLGFAFWGDAVIPGGGGGGDWGSKTVIGGGNGTWTFSSNSRGDRTGDDLADQVSERLTALQAFFNVSNGFQLHQLLSDDIQHIFALLYDDNFISRYTTSIYNPLSAVLSLHLIPQRLVDLSETTSPLTLSGYSISSNLPTPKEFPIVATLKSEHIGDVDLDSTDTFLDYAPYTRAYLHLPYIGVMDIDINAIAAGTISVDYITDATTGNCAAFVWCSDREGVHTYKYVATGNCAYTMPMFAAQQDGAAVGKIVNSTLGLAMSAISGNAAGAISAAAGIAGGIFDAATTQRNTQITGSFSGNASLISDTVCWIEIVRPVWAEPEHYQQLSGLPSMLSGTIAAFDAYGDAYSGYLRVVDLDTDGIQATDAEIRQIEQLLRAGIFVNPDT